ncbi:MAG: triphosphoribosyl-dephospho-CoA synthase [Oscillospiraceae bacterium]|nr:triphosphoribosyl-dephospho-CoA synthase [Oscillospiraceae bacterium]
MISAVNEAGVIAFLALIAQRMDTNILARSGLAAAATDRCTKKACISYSDMVL